MKKIIKNILIYISLLIPSILLCSPTWIRNVFGDVTLDEMIFHLMVPLSGTENSYIIDGLINILLPAVIFSSILMIVLKYRYKCILNVELYIRNKKVVIIASSYVKKVIHIFFICFCIIYFVIQLGIIEYIRLSLSSSSFIEENYVDPNNINIEFPENKRNLIYIFMESMESSYSSKEAGGILENNLIPNLTILANDNISFSNTEKLGGPFVTSGSTWTIAAMVSHFSGIPLKVSIDGNTYGKYSTFLPGITNLGDILEKAGYNQLFVLGSDIAFGGRNHFMEQHGNFDVFDYSYATQNNYYKEEDFVWWEYDDNTLYKFAKEELLKLASKDKPFNFTLLTVDTHFEDGYVCDNCETKYEEQYANCIACADKMIYDFVNWIKQQDFYENTTIVIVGDHLTMDVDFFENYNEEIKNRTVYNVYINSAVNTTNTSNRQFSTLDFFPTTLASLGVKFDGDMIGLGTNLFSNSKTLVEKYGLEYINDEFNKKSKFYDNKFLYNISNDN